MRLSLFFLSLFVTLNVFTQEENCLLWKISGKNLKEPSYLFGTIHITDERVFQFDSVFNNAFNSCEAYAMELLLDEIDKDDLAEAMLLKKGKVSDYMNDNEEHILDSVLTEKVGMGLFAFEKMKPFFIYSQLIQAEMAKDMGEALDMHLLLRARDQGMLTFGIEKPTEQFSAVDQITIEEQLDLIFKHIEEANTPENEMDKMIEAYLAADLQSLLELVTDTALPAKFNQAFLIDRNVVMAKRIIKISKKQPTFHAIGAAHLPGPNGVIALLRKKGYTVEPMCN
ncbi:MAG: hypothetical protein C0592_08250 [Marinilabiliales bacterium]|nr:MAG: hypothetical protein C0592_08250 [Marinilabiliales bacterium]